MTSALLSTLRLLVRTLILLGFMLLLLFPWAMRINYFRGQDTDQGHRKADALSIALANRLLWLFGIRPQVRGTPAEAPVLIAANHISWLDILALHASCALSFVAKAEIDDWPLFSYMARTGGTIFHQRGCHDSASGVAESMAERLKQGRSIGIFPEGGILPGSSVRVFHARMFRAAVEAGCPVQPAMIRYLRGGKRDDDASFRRGENMMQNIFRMLARPGAVADVEFLPTIDTAGKPRKALAEAARNAVVDSYEN